ncbi:MAG: hypothetical protein M3P94_03325 [Chloroflexota bacterium]|nr:hypothetical protein [Chloroflexota bacterium]
MRPAPRLCVVCKKTFEQRHGDDALTLLQYFENMCDRHASRFQDAMMTGGDRENYTDEPEKFAVARRIDIYQAREILLGARKAERMTG